MDNAYHLLFRTHTNGNDLDDKEIVEMIVEDIGRRIKQDNYFVQRWTL